MAMVMCDALRTLFGSFLVLQDLAYVTDRQTDRLTDRGCKNRIDFYHVG